MQSKQSYIINRPKSREGSLVDKISSYFKTLARDNKQVVNGQYFCEEQDLSNNDFAKTVQFLWENDDAFVDTIKNYIDDLLQSYVRIVESEDRLERGLIKKVDRINGEISWGKTYV